MVAEHIRGFLPYLEKYDMILVLEVHGDHGTGAILKEIVNLVGSDRVQINYDTANGSRYPFVITNMKYSQLEHQETQK